MFCSHVIKTLFGTKVGQSLKFVLAIFTLRNTKKKNAARRRPAENKPPALTLPKTLAALAQRPRSKSRPHIHTHVSHYLSSSCLHFFFFLKTKAGDIRGRGFFWGRVWGPARVGMVFFSFSSN